jgi:FAD/FMN-containing dehydrogenase
MSAVTEQELEGLEAFSGEILRAGDDGYEEARRGFNGLIDKRPALIAQCLGEADIAEAIAFARKAGLEISVRGGGHNVAGRCFTEGGLMIDLSRMKGVYVDPATRTARVQPGVSWGQLNRETQLHGLAVTGGMISTTGIAGLTLGGGLGWLMPKLGLATDNLSSARIVTADGAVQTASEKENADLFWGLRGAGANFGVVSSFE